MKVGVLLLLILLLYRVFLLMFNYHTLGFRKQTHRIPLRFFEEQLADDKDIVFTGAAKMLINIIDAHNTS